MKMFSFKLFQIIIWLLLINSFPIFSQTDKEIVEKIFSKIELGMETGKIELFSPYLMETVYIGFQSKIADYFSKEQAYYVLQDYIVELNLQKVKTLKKRISGNSPFISGKLISVNVVDKLHYFISLKYENGSWKIFQIIID